RHDLLAAGDAQGEVAHRLRDAENVVRRGIRVEGGIDAAPFGRLDLPPFPDLVGRLLAPVRQEAADAFGDLVAADRQLRAVHEVDLSGVAHPGDQPGPCLPGTALATQRPDA